MRNHRSPIWSLLPYCAAVVVGLVVLIFAATAGGPSYTNHHTVTINGRALPSAHAPGFGLPPKGTRPKALPPTSTPTLEMYDSVEVSTVPGCGPGCAVAGYTGGSWPTYGPLSRAFPQAFHVPIAVYNGGAVTNTGTGKIMCLDIEPGDAGPGDAGPWARYVRTHGMRACEYSSLSEMGAVRANLSSWGELNTTILWDANWTYSPHLDGGYGCTQWTDRSRNSNLDESTCAVSVFGPPAPPPDPYAIFTTVVYDLGHGIKAAEKPIVKGWNDHRCSRPTRRPVCGFLHYRLGLLDGRLKEVTHNWRHADLMLYHRLARARYIEHELTQTKGPWNP